MAVRRERWAKLNLWRVFLQIVVINVVLAVWLTHAVIIHNSDEIWASALGLTFLGLPYLIGWFIILRREPLRSYLFSRTNGEGHR